MHLDNQIPNDVLQHDDVPAPEAGWLEIARFAVTFDGYTVWGSFEHCAEVANMKRHRDLTDIRTCLFFEQRRWRHFGEDPDDEAMLYIRQLIEMIRARVSSRSV